MTSPRSVEDLLERLRSHRGHFPLESSHHGDLWLDLETLCADPRVIAELSSQLAARVRPHEVEVVCGPLVEGAFVALLVALADPCRSSCWSAGRSSPTSTACWSTRAGWSSAPGTAGRPVTGSRVAAERLGADPSA